MPQRDWPRVHPLEVSDPRSARAVRSRSVIDVLADDSILLVFLVIALGAGIGAVRIKGVSLGPAAALFAGLAVGAVDESLSEAGGLGLLRELGLVLFTYTIGLASGPTFFAGLRRGGAQAIVGTCALVAALAGLCALAASALDFTAADRAGLFAGSTTNTPALQAASEAAVDGDPVVAYSLSYPAAVASMLVIVTLLLGRKLRLPASLEPPPPARTERIVNWTVHVTTAGRPTLGELRARYPGVGFSRVEHEGAVSVATADQHLHRGDAVVVLGPEATVAELCRRVGERSDRHLPLDRTELDFRRVVVSNRRLAGQRLADLDLAHNHGVTVTRVRRGDDDLVAHDDVVLQLGDRVRVVGPSDRLGAVARLFGDSERRLAEVDALGFALGATAGLAVGTANLPLPGGIDVELGAGGGPLLIGLVLGIVSRTGPITWQIPHGANLVLRQLGILMFLASAGLGSGTTFADALGTRHGLELVAAGVVAAALFAGLVPLVVEVVLRRDVIETAGMFAGIETQPAALAYASERSAGDQRVSSAYALVFPAAMIAKIITVQFLV
jgi:putative transport protein